MSTVEEKLQTMLGSLVLQNAQLQTQLEAALEKIKELEPKKDEKKK